MIDLWQSTRAPYPVSIGLEVPGNATGFLTSVFSTQRLPSESIGALVLTLNNVVVGSAIHIETQSGTLIENRTADSTTEVFSVPAYVAGNSNNDLRIKVRKGSSAPFYQPYQTQVTAFVGSQSIFVSQISDE